MRQLVQQFLDWSLLVLRTGLLLFSADPKLEAMLGMEAAVKSCRRRSEESKGGEKTQQGVYVPQV